MEVSEKKIVYYVDNTKKVPFIDWLESLDVQIKAIIKTRLDRMRRGNFGDYKSVGEGVCELRIHLGPGYRIYFAINDHTLVLLLCGGEKRTQWKDIERAKKYWIDYRRMNYE